MVIKTFKNLSLLVAFKALLSSAFVTSILSVLPFGVSYTLSEGVLQKTAFVLSGVIIIIFFLWFTYYAYNVELSLIAEEKSHLEEDVTE